MTIVDHLLYAAAWASFGLGHSMLAGATSRRGLGLIFGRWHRIAYNLLALVHIGAVFAIGAMLATGSSPWSIPWPIEAALDVVVAAGVVLLLPTLRRYPAGPFIGWAQVNHPEETEGILIVDGLHLRFRHPLYSALLLILWGLARSPLGFATALWGSAYLLVGSIVEERRLLRRFGAEYRHYLDRTSRFLPTLRSVAR